MSATLSPAYAEELRVKNVFFQDFPKAEPFGVGNLSKCFKGNNFMISEIIGYTKSPGGLAVELSAGRGFNHELILGVTFRTMDGERIDDEEDPSGCVWSYAEAVEVIKEN